MSEWHFFISSPGRQSVDAIFHPSGSQALRGPTRKDAAERNPFPRVSCEP